MFKFIPFFPITNNDEENALVFISLCTAVVFPMNKFLDME